MKKKNILRIMLAGGAFVLASCAYTGTPDNPFVTGNQTTTSSTTTELGEEEIRTIYELAKENGFTGSYQSFLTSMKGDAIQLQIDENKLQWKYKDAEEWTDLISLSDFKGSQGAGIKTIEKTSKDGIYDTYTITMTDGTTSTFQIVNGMDGESATGKDGLGVQSFERIKTEGLVNTYVLTMTDGTTYTIEITDGKEGSAVVGSDGANISSIEKTSKDGLVDTYTITFSDGTQTTFEITNGLDGVSPVGKDGIGIVSVEKTGTVDLVDTYTVTLTNGNTYTFEIVNGQAGAPDKGKDGIGFASFEKVKTEGLVDTYTFTLTDGNSYTFEITNGIDGEEPRGEDGVGVKSFEKTKTEGLVDTYTVTLTDDTSYSFTITNGTGGAPDSGLNGKSAYEVYKANNPEYTKTEAEWLSDLVNGRLVTAECYTVTYMVDGDVYMEVPVPKHTLPNLPKAPLKTGYVFYAWYDDEDYKWNFNANIINKDITLHATWVDCDYSITLDANGGDSIGTLSVLADKPFEIPEPTRLGYTFDGWYLDGQKLESSIYDYGKNIALVAHWTEILDYTITYVTDENKQETVPIEKYTDITLPTPTKKGYTFDGWYLGEDLFENQTFSFTNDLTLVAKWIEITDFKITFDVNGGITVAALDVIKGSDFTLPTPKRYGYTFSGWYKDDALYEDAKYKELEDITLVAKWEITKENEKFVESEGLEIIDGVITGMGTCTDTELHINHPVDASAFMADTSITEVLFGPAVSSIGEFAFAECINLKTVSFMGDAPTLGNGAFTGEIEEPDFMVYVSTKYCDAYNDSLEAEWYEYVVSMGKFTATDTFIKYTVTFVTNSDAYSADSIRVSTIESLPWFYKNEEVITGWYDNATFTGSPICVGAELESDITLYAKWESIYEIEESKKMEDDSTGEYIYGRGDNKDQMICINRDITNGAFANDDKVYCLILGPNCTYVRDWAFVGCTNLERVYVLGNSLSLDSNSFGFLYSATFYVSIQNEWIAEELRERGFNVEYYDLKPVTFTFVTGTDDEIGPVTDTFVDLPYLQKEGYIFDGWYTEATYENLIEADYYRSKVDCTLYARWIEAKYNTQSEGLVVDEGWIIGVEEGFNASTVYINMPVANGAFDGISSINTIFIGKGCTYIEYQAFHNLSNLTRMYFYSHCPTMEDEAFYGSLNNSKLRVNVPIYMYDEYQDLTYLDWYINVVDSGKLDGYLPDTKVKKYSFDSKGGTAFETIETIYINEFPEPTKEGYYFGGWYMDEKYETKVETDVFYNETDITLYAKWLTQEEYDIANAGSRIDIAIIKTPGESFVADTSKTGAYYIKFTATKSGNIKLSANNSANDEDDDTIAYLYDENMKKIAYQDDCDESYHFHLVYTVEAGKTYYCEVRFYSHNEGTFTVDFEYTDEEVEFDPCYDDGE